MSETNNKRNTRFISGNDWSIHRDSPEVSSLYKFVHTDGRETEWFKPNIIEIINALKLSKDKLDKHCNEQYEKMKK